MPGSSSTTRMRAGFMRAPPPACGSGSLATRAGISTMNRAPAGRLSSTRICALCSATMWLTMASPRPVPRPLVEKYGRNSFSFSSGETPQPVSAITSSTVSGGGRLRGDEQPLHQRILHGLGGVVHQVHHHALELLAVEVDRRQIRRQVLGRTWMPSSRPVKTASAALHHFVQIRRRRLRGREARELRELVHQRLHRFHLLRRWWPAHSRRMRRCLRRA